MATSNKITTELKTPGTKWLSIYLSRATDDQKWIARNAGKLLHKRDLREAGYDEYLLRGIHPSGVRVPGGKKLSANFVTRRDVAQAVAQAARKRKIASRGTASAPREKR